MLIPNPLRNPIPTHFWLIALAMPLAIAQADAQQPAPPSDDVAPAHVLEEVSQLVAEHFYDPDFDSEAWKQQVTAQRPMALAATSEDQLADSINRLLATLHTSHTYYYSRTNPKRYQLLGVFHQLYNPEDGELFRYEGIGIDIQPESNPPIVTAAYDGLPASIAGVQFGDRILSIDDQPFHAMNSFRGKAGQPVEMKLKRGTETLEMPIQVAWLDGRTMFETALESSVRIIQQGDFAIGYLHAWSYAGSKFQDTIRETLLFGKLSHCDALILDLRDGWGGADVNYLNLFRPPIVNVESASRTSKPRNFSGVWGKPVALLINGRSTSGKELFAFGFKKLKLGPIVGQPSAGAVVAGRAFLLRNGAVLYLAVSDVRVDGQRLEGRGVTPDTIAIRSVDDISTDDPQIEAAAAQLAKQLSSGPASHSRMNQ